MGWNRSVICSVVVTVVSLVGCADGRGGTGRPSGGDAGTGDASWTCEVGSYYECVGTGGCAGAAQCITGGKMLGACRCISTPTDGGVTSDGATNIDNRICEPGQAYPCSGAGGCTGMAPCEDDGRSLGICECPDAGVMPDASLGDGRCSNASDSTAIGQSYSLGTVEETQSFCQLSCALDSSAPPTCVVDCVYDFTGGAVSRECLSCYDEKASCESQNACELLCLLAEEDCYVSCACGQLGGTNCEAAFDTCTGIPASACN